MTMLIIDIVLLFLLPFTGYLAGRAHGRLLHMDHECEAEAQGYQAGVKHGLEAGIMSGMAGARTTMSRQRRGWVLDLN